MDFYVDILANIIIQQYFWNSRCLIVISDNTTQFQYTGQLPLLNVKSESGYIQSETIFRHHGCQGVVIKSKRHLTIFENLEHEIKMNMERFNQRKYLFLPCDDMSENVSDIFQLGALNYVADSVVVQKDDEKSDPGLVPKTEFSFSLWSHQYVGSKNNNDKVFLDKWFSRNRSFGMGTPLYKNKLMDQMGREIKMATFQYEPYSIVGSNLKNLKGSEMMTTLMFAKQYNMTPTLVINPEDYWGEIFDNWTGKGLLGNLVLDKADIGFSALYSWEFAYYFLDMTKPLVRTGITCLVPAPKLTAGWLTPFYSYSKEMWYAVGSCFVFSVMSHFLTRLVNASKQREKVNKGSSEGRLSQSTFTILKIFVLQVMTKSDELKSVVGKYLMGGLFVFSLILSSSYSSGLSTIMTIPKYENPINTVREFAESGLHWGGTQDAWTISIETVEEPIYRDIVNRFVATTEEDLRNRSKIPNFAFPLERLPNRNYAIGSYIQEDVIDNYYLMQEDLYWEQCVFMARKSSILLPLLDMFVLRVFETGLVSYWQNEGTALYMNSKVQKALKYYNYKKDGTIVKLKWMHVEGAFAILCIGLTTSIIVFLFEVISSHTTTNTMK